MCVSVLCLSSWLQMHLAEVVHKACTLMDTGRTFRRRAATIPCKYLSPRVPQRPPVNRLLLLCRLPYASSLDLQYFHSHQSLPSMSPALHVNCTSLSFSCSPFSYLSSLPHLLRCSLIANANPSPSRSPRPNTVMIMSARWYSPGACSSTMLPRSASLPL